MCKSVLNLVKVKTLFSKALKKHSWLEDVGWYPCVSRKRWVSDGGVVRDALAYIHDSPDEENYVLSASYLDSETFTNVLGKIHFPFRSSITQPEIIELADSFASSVIDALVSHGIKSIVN